MSIEDRLAALEARVRAAEDQLEIIRLLNSYGPLVDCLEGEAASHLWVEGGTYDFGGERPLKAYDDLAGMYAWQAHIDLTRRGSGHVTATPRIIVKGDKAEALAYSFVIERDDDGKGWHLFRAAVNHYTLTRTPEGWRIVERYNRPLNGSDDSHDTLRRALRTSP